MKPYYNSNVLLGFIGFLLFVILFVLLHYFYARFVWSHPDPHFPRRNRRITVTTTRIIPSFPLGVNVQSPVETRSDDKGLDLSVISSIPLFVYKDSEEEEECVICLGLWEKGDFGRNLRNCGHGFHVECIDMWFSSHSSCPVCRSPVLSSASENNLKAVVNGIQEEEEVRLQLSDANNIVHDGRLSLSIALPMMEDDLKTGFDDSNGNGIGEGEVRIDVNDDDHMDGERRTPSMTSSTSSSLIRMSSSSSRSEHK